VIAILKAEYQCPFVATYVFKMLVDFPVRINYRRGGVGATSMLPATWRAMSDLAA
jgi:hypothetical protein